jgi:hypothetical protein
LLGYPALLTALIDRSEKPINKVDQIRDQSIHNNTKEPGYHHTQCSRFPWCCQSKQRWRSSGHDVSIIGADIIHGFGDASKLDFLLD